jgi:hypothetical protein
MVNTDSDRLGRKFYCKSPANIRFNKSLQNRNNRWLRKPEWANRGAFQGLLVCSPDDYTTECDLRSGGHSLF